MTFESKKPANLDALIDRIAQGEITRQQAAAEAGLNYETFKGWLRRTPGALERLQHTRGNVGANHRLALARSDPDKDAAYAQAVAEALASNQSVRALWQAKYKSKGLSYVYLCERVDRARREQLAHRQATADDVSARVLEAAVSPDNGDGKAVV